MSAILINGTREQAYWQQRPDNDAALHDDTAQDRPWGDDDLFRTQPGLGPGLVVLIRRDGIEVLNTHAGRPYRPGYARWLANRLIEAAGIYEMWVHTDGTEDGAVMFRYAYAQDVETRQHIQVTE